MPARSAAQRTTCCIVSLWPRKSEVRAARQVLLVAGHDLLHRAGYGAQIGAFHVGIDVEDRLAS